MLLWPYAINLTCVQAQGAWYGKTQRHHSRKMPIDYLFDRFCSETNINDLCWITIANMCHESKQ